MTVGSILSAGITRKSLVMIRALGFSTPGAGRFTGILGGLGISAGMLIIMRGSGSFTTLSTHGLPNMAIIGRAKVGMLSIISGGGLILARTTLSGMRRTLVW